mgnify:CR=1 FL=1
MVDCDQANEHSARECTELLEAAKSTLDNGDRTGALVHLLQASTSCRGDTKTALEIGRVLLRIDALTEAIAHLEQTIDSFPDSVEVKVELALAYQHTSDHQRAREVMREVVDLQPGNRQALVGFGNLEASLGDHAQALSWFERALELRPDDPGLTGKAAAQLRALGRVDEARDRLTSLLADTSDSVVLLLELARTEQAAGHHATALEISEQLLSIDPNHRAGLLHAGACARALGQTEAAFTYFQQAVDNYPDDPIAATRLGEQLRTSGQADQALQWMHTTVDKFPDSVEVKVELALAYQHTSDHQFTLDLLEQVVAFNPCHPGAVTSLARILAQVGLGARAIQVLQRAEACAGPSMQTFRQQRCRILIDMGKLSEAATILPELDNQSPRLENLLLELIAEIAVARWDLPTAESLLQVLARRDPQPSRFSRLASMRLLQSRVEPAWEAQRAWAEAVRHKGIRDDDVVVRAHRGMVGDLLNEVSLDLSGAARAQDAIRHLDIEMACQNVRGNPGSFAAATGLLVTLRCAGAFNNGTNRPSGTGETAIPNQVTQAWLGSVLPNDAAALAEEWSTMHPEWNYNFFDETTAVDFIGDAHGAAALRAFRSAQHPATKADLLRLAFLAVHGGVWADIDDRPLRDLSFLLQGQSLVLWQEHLGSVGNNFIGVVAGHPVIQDALDEAIRNCIAGFSESTWLATGPGLITRAFARWLSDGNQLSNPSAPNLVLTRQEVRKYIAIHQPLAYKRTNLSWSRAANLR